MKGKNNAILLIGIGNSGRQDDGLGWAFLDDIKDAHPDRFRVEYRYQLQVEDAELCSRYDTVIFVDAFQGYLPDGFSWTTVQPKDNQAFTSHALAPETIIHLTESIFAKAPKAYVLAIAGQQFALSIGLTEIAKHNLMKATTFFSEKLNLSTTESI